MTARRELMQVPDARFARSDFLAPPTFLNRLRFTDSSLSQLSRVRLQLAGLTPRGQNSAREIPVLTPPDVAVLKMSQQQGDVIRAFLADVDGTLYTKFSSIPKDSRIDNQTKQILETQHIPLIIDTGGDPINPRGIDSLLKRLAGLGKADAVIGNFGTTIYRRLSDGRMVKDPGWEEILGKSEVTVKGKKTTWKAGGQELVSDIESVIRQEWTEQGKKGIGMGLKRVSKNDQFCVKFEVTNISWENLDSFAASLGEKMQGTRIIYSESLRYDNSREFSGTIAVIPAFAGKLGAAEYLLQNYQAQLKRTGDTRELLVHAFGDASGDEFLFKKSQAMEGITFLSHAVNTERHPLVTRKLEQAGARIVHPNSDIERLQLLDGVTYIHRQQGPEAILDVARAIAGESPNARNSPIRNVLPVFYRYLNWFYPRNLSANQVSYKRLDFMLDALKLSQNQNPNRLKIYWNYGRSILGDLVDGYRARKEKGNSKEEHMGQLLDPFVDRLGEILQLGFRAQQRLKNNPDNALLTIEAMVSCVLPSLARSQTEFLTGRSVPEDSEGSMRSRTWRLFRSLRSSLRKKDSRSIQLDSAILATNVKTYQTRKERSFQNRVEHPLEIGPDMFTGNSSQLRDFRTSALERFAMNVGLLQELDAVARDLLKSLPPGQREEKLSQYSQWTQKNGLNDYFKENIDMTEISEAFGFVDNPKLRLSNYIMVVGGQIIFRHIAQ